MIIKNISINIYRNINSLYQTLTKRPNVMIL